MELAFRAFPFGIRAYLGEIDNEDHEVASVRTAVEDVKCYNRGSNKECDCLHTDDVCVSEACHVMRMKASRTAINCCRRVTALA